MGSSSVPRAAITDFQVNQAIEACMRRLPEGLRFAPPGGRAHIARHRQGPTVTSLSLRFGGSHSGCTLDLSCSRLGLERTEAVLRAVAHRCGLVLDSQEPRGPKRGAPKTTNPLGIFGVSAVWRCHRSQTAHLYVVGQIGKAHPNPMAAARSVQKHGLDGALDQVIDHLGLKQAVTPEDREAALQRLRTLFMSPP